MVALNERVCLELVTGCEWPSGPLGPWPRDAEGVYRWGGERAGATITFWLSFVSIN